MKGKIDRRLVKGSKAPGIGYLYVLVLMFVAIAAATVLSGGFVPVDPNGPGGPPTLPPYFDSSDYGQQKIILPSDALTPDARKNLQLKTFLVNTCGLNTAILFLIDTSASMQDYGKITKEKDDLNAFVKQLAGLSVIGMVTFSAEIKERVPMDYYKNNKQQVGATIDGLSPQGWTRTRTGFLKAQDILSAAISQNKFPGYHYNLILLTDGVPEIPQEAGAPPRICEAHVADPLWGAAGRCFSQEEDPRIPTNVATTIKNLGVQIYTVAIESPESSDVYMKPYLENLLSNLASTPTSSHFYTSLNAGNLNQILDSVITKICQSNTDQQMYGQ